MKSDDFIRLDATAQAELVRRREVTLLELVDTAIARIEALNPSINAVIIALFEKARAQTRRGELQNGPFRGVPFLLKDLLGDSAGDPIHMGMCVLRDAGLVAPYDRYLVAKFRQAGFVFVGKTNVPESGCSGTAEPVLHGPTHNPWDLGRSAGGSSGGSAAAVASRMVAVAHANDACGSIRIPASECGVVGLKPSRALVSFGPDAGETCGGLAIDGVVSRSVRDTAAVLDAIAGNMPGDPYQAPMPPRPLANEAGADPGRLRVGFMRRSRAEAMDLDPDCHAAVQDVARLLESLGHWVEESHPAALDDEGVIEIPWDILTCNMIQGIDQLEKTLGRRIGRDDLEFWTWTMMERGKAISTIGYLTKLQQMHGWGRRIVKWWAEDGFDILLTPTLTEPPPRLGELKARPDNLAEVTRREIGLIQFTSPFNASGQPAVSLPLYFNANGLPIGVQLVAGFGREDLLVRLAAQLEQARPWANRIPPGCA